MNHKYYKIGRICTFLSLQRGIKPNMNKKLIYKIRERLITTKLFSSKYMSMFSLKNGYCIFLNLYFALKNVTIEFSNKV